VLQDVSAKLSWVHPPGAAEYHAQESAHLCIGHNTQSGGKLLLCEAFALSGRSTFGCAPHTRQVVLREPSASKELHRLAARNPVM
jgi:hypothetical protein